MKAFSDIREFFWPLLEKVELPGPVLLDENQIFLNSDKLENILKYTIDYYNSENERIKLVEGKSSLFIGTTSVAASIILGITSLLIKENEFSNGLLILIIILILLTVYLVRTIWFSIKVLERESYQSITIDDFIGHNSEIDYYRKLVIDIANKTRINSKVINRKVDNMTMAQEYFKRVIITILVYSFVLLTIYISKSKFNIIENLFSIINLKNKIQIINVNIIILYVLVILSIIMSSLALIKNTKKN